jgi:hypothetical protein
MDGTLVATTGSCKQGMDVAYNGVWGYHPLALTLAETGEVLRVVNRSGNRPSHEGAAAEVDRCMKLCLGAGFTGGWRRAGRSRRSRIGGHSGSAVVVVFPRGRLAELAMTLNSSNALSSGAS